MMRSRARWCRRIGRGLVAVPVVALLFLVPRLAVRAQDPFLTATPDADAADPFIAAKAAELGHDPGQIFAFVRDQIRYESYAGSLRGARGTLWSQAGNALDKASLMIALLRASNVPARYAQGALADPLAQQLILGMFPAPLRVLGCLTPGTPLADPAGDQRLLAEARSHYWVQLAPGGGFQDADPNFPGAQLGQTFAAVQGTFAEVPDALRHKVSIRLRRELTLPGAALLAGGAGQDTVTVLEQSYPTASLVGRSLSLGHFVTASAISAIFTVQTNTYSPYLLVNQRDGGVTDDLLVRGDDYQEVLTNFPLGNQVLTGVFLDVTTVTPQASGGAQEETVTKTLLDRIGVVGRRQGGATVNVPASDQPVLSDADIVTLEVSVANHRHQTLLDQLGVVEQTRADLDALRAAHPDLDAAPPEVQQQAVALVRRMVLQATSFVGATVAFSSDSVRADLEAVALTRGYLDSPRIIAVSNRTGPEGRLSVDILRNKPRAEASPIQARQAATAFRWSLGLVDSVIEGAVLDPESATGHGASSAAIILQALARPGVRVLALTPGDAGQLSLLPLAEEAKVRILDALSAGNTVFVPDAMVDVNGRSRIAWIERDPAGHAITVADDGEHSGVHPRRHTIRPVRPRVIGEERPLSLFEKIYLQRQAQFTAAENAGTATANAGNAARQVRTIADAVCRTPLFAAGKIAGVAGVDAGTNASWLNKSCGKEPPIGLPLAGQLTQSPAFDGLGGGGGVAVDAVADPFFSVPVGGADVLTVFRVGFKNQTASADTFTIEASDIPAGFSVCQSIPRLTLPPGATGEITVALVPEGSVPPPGAPASFRVSATSASNPAITAAIDKSFSVPSVNAVAVAAEPSSLATTPGTPVATTLALTAVGNVPETVELAVALPPGLTASALAPLSLGVGETAMRVLTLTPAAGTSLNTTLTAAVTVTFGPAASPLTRTVQIPVAVVAPGAAATASAAAAARQLGDADLAGQLEQLGAALTNLAQDPTDAVDRGQVLAGLDALIERLATSPDTAALAAQLAALRTSLSQAATPAAVQAALADIGGALASVQSVLSASVRHRFTARLEPNSQVASPQVPVSFLLSLQNAGTEGTTYELSVEGLPPGVTGQPSVPSVTLAPGEVSSNLFVTLTQTSTAAVVPVGFDVRISPASAPELSRIVSGSLTARSEIVSVVNVTATPPFGAAGTTRALAARLLNAVNQVRQGSVDFAVKGPTGAVVHQGSTPPFQFGVFASLVTVDLGTLDTTGFAPGTYTTEVTVKDAGGSAIPGATGTGTFLVGTPVTASIAVSPEVVPAGTRTVTATLQIDGQVPATEFELIGQLALPAHSVALNGAVGYFCGPNGIQIVDVSDPGNPVVQGSFGAGQIVNSVNTQCKVSGDQLIVRTLVNNGATIQLRVYSLADPAAPQLLTATPASADYAFGVDTVVAGSTVLVPTIGFCFFLNNHDVFEHFGDIVAFDISDPAAPTLAGALFDGPPRNLFGCIARGGPNNIWQPVLADPTTLLVATSTVQGTSTSAGVGRIRVIDIANPAQLSVVEAGELQIPGTVQVLALAREGNLAVALGTTGGWNDFQQDLGLTGNVVVATIDLANPRQPALLATRVLDRASRGLNVPMEAVGNGLFVGSSLGGPDDPPQTLIVDARDPRNPLVSRVDVPADVRITAVAGDIVYATSVNGFSIYRLGSVGTLPVTARVPVPKGTGVTIVPNSFSEPPDEVVAGAQFDTLVWRRGLTTGATSLTLSWQEQAASVQPGEAREVTLESAVDFVSQGADGRIALAALAVLAEQVLALDPPTRTVRPGEVATYTVALKNPSTVSIDYALALEGVPAEWIGLPGAVTAPPGGTQQVALTLRSEALAALGEYGFAVTARATGIEASVLGTLVLAGEPVLPDGEVRSVVASLIPAQATAGQGTAARFTLRVTNVGTLDDRYAIAVSAPAGFAVTAVPSALDVPVGIGNFRDVQVAVVPPPGTPAGDVAISARATSTADATVFGEAPGTVSVAAAGVAVGLSPSSGPPGSTFQMTVTNRGATAETFDLSLGGPAAVAATLAVSSVALAPGASQVVAVNVGAIDFATRGALDLTGVATARSNAAVRGRATARVAIGETAGIVASFDPALITLPAPGAAAFLLTIQSTGNREDDYRASIVATSGPIAASLVDLAGQPAQQVPLFSMPGLATAALHLDATLQSAGQATVTVRVQSLADPSVVAESTATLRSQSASTSPTASAGPDQQVHLGAVVALDGSASDDPDAAPQPLSYAWTFASTPPGSALGAADIAGAATATASFEPDVRGDYVLRLTVSDGEASASDEVLVQVLNSAPVAVAGRDRNAARGSVVALDGSDSFDPDGDMITYEWTFQGVPAGSGLTDASIVEPAGPAPSFVPDLAGAYVLKLVVRDGEATSDPSLVTVRAWAANVPPNAHAGADRHVAVGAPAGLDGRASQDPDGGPGPLTFAWTVAAVPPGSQVATARLSGATGPLASFVPDVTGEYRMALRVGDGDATSDDEVVITAQAANVAPNADAGANIDAGLGVELTLNGAASADLDGGPAPLAHRWRLVSVPAGSGLGHAQIADADTPQPRFTPDVPGPYVLELTVFDGAAADFDNVLVVAREATVPTCFGRLATIFVRNGAIVGGADSGKPFRGVLHGTAGDDVIAGTPGNDRITGNGGNDVLCGGDGNDVIQGGPGHDMVDGGPGKDLVKTFGGNDYVLGGDGNDAIEAGDGDDVVDGGSGNDLIKGQTGHDRLRGGHGDDAIEGGPGNDLIQGGPGRDLLKGQDGDDVIDGGPDLDHLDGGSGADECRDEGSQVKGCER
jgi:uncharacterized membrane protein